MIIACIDGRVTALAGVLLLGLFLGGCATSSPGSSLMDARAETPVHAKPGGYLPVEDLPPNREAPAMTADERLKLQNELTAARDRQAAAAKAQGTVQPVQPANQAVQQ